MCRGGGWPAGADGNRESAVRGRRRGAARSEVGPSPVPESHKWCSLRSQTAQQQQQQQQRLRNGRASRSRRARRVAATQRSRPFSRSADHPAGGPAGGGTACAGERGGVGPGLRDEGGPGIGVVVGLGGDPPGRAGEAERRPLPAVEEEAGGAEQGPPAAGVARGRRGRRGRREGGPRQGAAAGLHPEGGLRGAHRQVRLLHPRHHRPQGDRLSVPRRELLERLHRPGAHRLPEPARPRGLQEEPPPPRGGRGGGGGRGRPRHRRRPRPTPRPRPLRGLPRASRPRRNAATRRPRT